jgi:hypothetical protein
VLRHEHTRAATAGNCKRSACSVAVDRRTAGGHGKDSQVTKEVCAGGSSR